MMRQREKVVVNLLTSEAKGGVHGNAYRDGFSLLGSSEEGVRLTINDRLPVDGQAMLEKKILKIHAAHKENRGPPSVQVRKPNFFMR